MKVLKGMAKNFVLVSLWTLILLGGALLSPSGAVSPEKIPGEQPLQPLDFDAAARLAIRQSPFLTKSDLEIQVRRLDETDSKSDFFPSVNFRTRYFVNNLSQAGLGSSSPYSLEFTSDPYSPAEAYFSLQVRKLITRIAILSHLKVISEGLHRLGRSFLEMDALGRVAQVQKELIQLAEKQLAYVQERQKIGEGDALAIKVASQELEVARLTHRQLLETQKKHHESIRTYLAWPATQELRLNLPPSQPQILGNFEGLPNSEPLLKASYDVKIQAIKKELQRYNITLAKTKLLPTLFMGVQTPDPLTLVQSRSLFFFVGASIPVWDGFKRLRNVSRQKTILKQVDAEMQEKEMDCQEKWREAQENLADGATALKISQSQLDLASLKARQHEVRYQSLGEPLSIKLEGEKGVCEAQKNVIMKTLDYNLARLHFRSLANELVSRYVDENSLPRRFEEK